MSESESDSEDHLPAEAPEEDTPYTQLMKAVVGGLVNAPDWAQKAVMKVAERLVLPYVDIPVAWAEGVSTQIRARNEARANVTLKTASLLIENPQDNPVAARAMAREATKIFREQVSLEDIISIAAKQVEKEAPKDVPTGDITDDWLNAFEREAAAKSSDEMKEVFGRILAGEILQPGQFSIRAIRLMGSLTPNDALALRRLFGLMTITKTLHLVLDLETAADQNGLSAFGLSYNTLSELGSLGIISTDLGTDSYLQKDDPSLPARLIVVHASQRFALKEQLSDGQKTEKITLRGLMITRLGIEISKIVEPIHDPKYTASLQAHLTKRSLQMTPILTP